MKLVDIGVNLTNARFDQDRHEVVEQALAAGVEKIIITGTNVAESKQAAELANLNPKQLYSTAGVHPHDAKNVDSDFIQTLASLYQQQNVVAIGECGLDFNRDFSPRATQEKVFEQQLELASQLDAPLFMHQRDAHPRFIELIRPYQNQLHNAVVHCFTGNQAELEACLELGLSIGFTGWVCDERRGLDVLALTKLVPNERILLETDAPYLLPRNMRPKPKKSRNLPQYLPHILQQVAAARSQDINELACHTWQNAHRLFGLGS